MSDKMWKETEKMATEMGLFQNGGYMTVKERLREEGFQEGLQEGLQKGLQEGLQKGRQKGFQKGFQEGRQKGREELILKMLKKELDISLVSKVTGLSEEEIRKLKSRT